MAEVMDGLPIQHSRASQRVIAERSGGCALATASGGSPVKVACSSQVAECRRALASEPLLTSGDGAREAGSMRDAFNSMGLAQESQKFQTQAPMDDFDSVDFITAYARSPSPEDRALDPFLLASNSPEVASSSFLASTRGAEFPDGLLSMNGLFSRHTGLGSMQAAAGLLRLPPLNESVLSDSREGGRVVEAEEVLAPELGAEAFFPAMEVLNVPPELSLTAAAVQVPGSGEEGQLQRDSTTWPGGVAPSSWATGLEAPRDFSQEASAVRGYDPDSAARVEDEEEELQTAHATITKWVGILNHSQDDDDQEEENLQPPPSTDCIRAGSYKPSVQQTRLVLGLPAPPSASEPSLVHTSTSSPSGTQQLAGDAGAGSPPVQQTHTSLEDVLTEGEPEFRCPPSRASSVLAPSPTLEAGNELAAGSTSGGVARSEAEVPADVTGAAQAPPVSQPQLPVAATAQEGNPAKLVEPTPFVDKRVKLQPPFLRSPPPIVVKQLEGQRPEWGSLSQSPGSAGFRSGSGGEKGVSMNQAQQADPEVRSSSSGQATSSSTGRAGSTAGKGRESASSTEKSAFQREPRASASGEGSLGQSAFTGEDEGAGMTPGTVTSAAKKIPSDDRPRSFTMAQLPGTRSLLSGSSKGPEGVPLTPSSAARHLDSGKGLKGAESPSADALRHLKGSADLRGAVASPTSGSKAELSSIPAKSPKSVVGAGIPPSAMGKLPHGTGREGTPMVSRASINPSPAEAAQKQSPQTLRPPSPVTELRAKLLEIHAALAPRPSLLSASTKKQLPGRGKPRQEKAELEVKDRPQGASRASRNTEALPAPSASTTPTSNKHTGRRVSDQQDAQRPQTVGEEGPVLGRQTEAQAHEPSSPEAAPLPEPSTSDATPATGPTASAKKIPVAGVSPQGCAKAIPVVVMSPQQEAEGRVKPGGGSACGARVLAARDSEQPRAEGSGLQGGPTVSGGKQLGPGKRKQSGQSKEPCAQGVHWDSLLDMPLVSREQKKQAVADARGRPGKSRTGWSPDMSFGELTTMDPSAVAQKGAERSVQGSPAVLGKRRQVAAKNAPGADTGPQPSPAQFFTPQGKGKRPPDRTMTSSAASEPRRKRKMGVTPPSASLRARLPPNRRDLPEEDLDLWDLVVMYSSAARK